MIHPDFDNLSKITQIELQRIVGKYHYRNGKTQTDGSAGEIRITPRQFLIALTKAYLLEKKT